MCGGLVGSPQGDRWGWQSCSRFSVLDGGSGADLGQPNCCGHLGREPLSGRSLLGCLFLSL